MSAPTGSTLTAPRLLVARRTPDGLITPIGVLDQLTGGYSFAYLRQVLDVPAFRPLLGFEDLERRYVSTELFPLFSQRLMDPRRTDYQWYLTVLGLSEGASPMVVLGRSEGRRAGDAITLVAEPEVDASGRTSASFFVHGLRHRAGAEPRVATLRKGEQLALRDDLQNPVNPRALLVTRNAEELGWIPDLLLDYVHRVRETGEMTIRVAQVNGADTPPNLRLRVQLEGCTPEGYLPFHGEDWATTA
ncbi:hypothetical protein [Sphaerimonospora thailandensis]|uniref:hypothetical protein n=1 Tax=Sphaerimonospora thailandensis TaxID=795644 RepID=UPI0019509244|nr:hypothetical protein [Sphaerimonospora thailandensis]